MERQVFVHRAGMKDKKESNILFAIFHATSVNGGAMLIAAVIGSYFSVYMTDTLQIPAASASLVMFIATLWDAINDPIMGVVADRTKSRWGRYRPYLILPPIILTICATMIWVDPGFSTTGKVLWVLVFYIGYGMMVTMVTMPQMSLLPACVKDNDKRNMIITLGAACTALMFTIGSTFGPNMKSGLESLLNISNGYVPLMLICGVLALISFWGLFATAHEHYLVEDDVTEEKGNPFKQMLIVLKHKEMAPFIVVWIMASLGYGLMFASSVYYVMYYLARPDLITLYMGIVSVGALVSMIVVMPIVLKVFKTGQRSLFFTQGVTIICYAILFFFGKDNLILLYVLTFAATSIGGMSNALVNVLVNDAIDYIQYKEGISANGIISSVKGFAQKCGNTISNAGILAVLAISGYVANAIGQQPASAMFAINFIRFGAPIVTGAIMLFCLRFNPVEKYYDQIKAMKEQMK